MPVGLSFHQISPEASTDPVDSTNTAAIAVVATIGEKHARERRYSRSPEQPLNYRDDEPLLEIALEYGHRLQILGN